MNGKLYVFGIGGTGSRVLKSLIMLAASGVKINAKSIVPIIIDPDFANADLTRTIELMKIYSSIHNKLTFNGATNSPFFSLEVDDNVVNDYRINLKDTKNKKFKEFIEYNQLDFENKALASILFSENNLEADMEVGFKGNPNMGSIVLNQFTSSQDFINFAASFTTGDRIFIISSIFGGTGASGFPLLLKNIRGLSNSIQNYSSIQNAPIGAVTVMPYFGVKPDDDSSIDSSTFIGKTKAALQYYEKNINGDHSSVNLLYYIGDMQSNMYENQEGGQSQRNNAHFIELATALSIVDFISIPDTDPVLSCTTDSNNLVYAPNPVFKEFGITNNVKQILFSDLSNKTNDIIRKPLTEFILFSRYIQEHLKQGLKINWAVDNKFDDAFINGLFMSDVQKFTKMYITWLREMEQNDRSFAPFNIDVKASDLFSIVVGVKPSKMKSLWSFNKSGYDLFDAALNQYQGQLPKNYSLEQKFVELFSHITNVLVEKKFKF